MGNIRSYSDLRVYKGAFEAAMRIFELTRHFPVEEKFSLVDQIRRSSRSVCTNIAEAWRKRRYPAHFVSKLSDSESEAEETRVLLEFSMRCGYITAQVARELGREYHGIIAQIVCMISEPEEWTIRASPSPRVAPSPRP